MNEVFNGEATTLSTQGITSESSDRIKELDDLLALQNRLQHYTEMAKKIDSKIDIRSQQLAIMEISIVPEIIGLILTIWALIYFAYFVTENWTNFSLESKEQVLYRLNLALNLMGVLLPLSTTVGYHIMRTNTVPAYKKEINNYENQLKTVTKLSAICNELINQLKVEIADADFEYEPKQLTLKKQDVLLKLFYF